jgi:hypothetical protein
MLLSGQTVLGAVAWHAAPSALVAVGGALPIATNTAPTVAQPISVNNGAPITGNTVSLSVLGKDDGGEAKLTYTWSITAAPSGGTATFSLNKSNAAKNTTVTFSKAGTYQVCVTITDATGLSTTALKSAIVSSALAGIRVSTSTGQIVNPATAWAVAGTSQSLVAQGLDQFGNVLATQPGFTWSVTTVPTGATQPSLATTGTTATVTFAKIGTYGLKVQTTGTTVIATSISLNVTAAVSGVRNVSTATVSVSGTTLQPALPTFVDQFGNAVAAPALTWSATVAPQGAPAPVFTTSGGVTTVTFGMAGSYSLTAKVTAAPTISFVTSVIVSQTLTGVAVSPNACTLIVGAKQQFTAQGLDQFGKAMAAQPTFTWSASAGSISGGAFTAPASATVCTVTAKSGTVGGTATVTVGANTTNLQDPTLATLVIQLDADGSLSRQDMIQILRTAGASGTVSATDFSDLKKLLSQAATFNIPGYVQVLAGDVVNGNPANATYQGKTLGNLAAGSSATQLNNLVGKWFLGTDHPVLCDTSLVYRSVAGSLFPHTPSHLDEDQGELGDCYLISALGTLADSNPAAVENMIINNGDGTYTVRFYTSTYGISGYQSDGGIVAGFTNNQGTADYVTVDSMLPTTSAGILAYADYGDSYTNSANVLWIPLIEKAYAQWNQTGREGRDGTNNYASIEGGWMATVDAQVLGHNGIDYIMTSTPEQIAVTALAAKKAVTIGTEDFSGNPGGLYADHAYAIIGYNAGTDKFILYNPWGTDQPSQLTWSQLQTYCDQMCVCDTSGSVPIAGVASAVSAKTALVRGADIVVAPSSRSAAPTSSPDTMAAATNGPSAVGGASRKMFVVDDYHPVVPWQPDDVATPVERAGRASLVDATLSADDLWLPDESLAALV